MKLYKIQNTRIIVVDEIFATHQVYRDFDNLYDEIDKIHTLPEFIFLFR